MNRNFLSEPAQLNQSLEINSSSGGASSGITRRTFVKRSGGATIATMVAWKTIATARAAEDGSDDGASFSTLIEVTFS